MRGPQHIDEASQSDPVLIRADGSYLYTFTSVVDDIDLGITHVIRGDDHVTNTGAQIAALRGAGRDAAALRPSAAAGEASRRRAVEAHGQLVDRRPARRGYRGRWPSTAIWRGSAPPIASSRCRLWTRWPPTFALDHFDAATPKFDLARTGASECPPAASAAVRRRCATALAAMDSMPSTSRSGTWSAPTSRKLADAARLAGGLPRRDCAGDRRCRHLPPRPPRLLPPEPWDAETWSAWTEAVKTATGRKGKDAVPAAAAGADRPRPWTGDEGFLPLIGRDRALARLRGRAAALMKTMIDRRRVGVGDRGAFPS